MGVCMLATRFAGGLRARPLEARPDRDDGRIWFVTDLHSGKEEEIESEDDVDLVYLSITARAQVLRDHAKTAVIWKLTDNVCGAVPTIQMSACCASRPSPRNSGTGRRARPSPRSNSPRRGLPAPSPISGRTARLRSIYGDVRLH